MPCRTPQILMIFGFSHHGMHAVGCWHHGVYSTSSSVMHRKNIQKTYSLLADPASVLGQVVQVCAYVLLPVLPVMVDGRHQSHSARIQAADSDRIPIRI